jgi:hypothetical protein
MSTQYETLDDLLKNDAEFMSNLDSGEQAIRRGDFEFIRNNFAQGNPSDGLRRAFERANLSPEDRERLLWQAVESQIDLIGQIIEAKAKAEVAMQITMTAALLKNGGSITLSPEDAERAKSESYRLTSHPSSDGKHFVYELEPVAPVNDSFIN